MNKKLIILVMLILGAVFLMACGRNANDDNKFVVGFDAEFPPYGFIDSKGEYVGFDLDLAEEVSKRNGWELVKQPIDWDAKDMELKSGNVDCIWNGFTINGREDKYTWTSAYVNNSQVFVVATDSKITDQAGLAGKVVATQKDSSALAALNDDKNKTLKSSFKNVIEFGDYNTAFLELEMGTVDAIVMDIGVAKAQMASRTNKTFLILDKDLASEKYGVGFLLGNVELRDKVETTLMEMLNDGTFLKIATKWDLQDSVCLGE